jgi:phosphoglycerate kinase
MATFSTFGDHAVQGKIVLVRVDFNTPIHPQTKEITDDTRIRAHAPTLDELAEHGGKVVVMAHQGRPDSPDFSTLQKHSVSLSQILGRPVRYVDDVHGEKALSAITALRPGEILMLDNLRLCDDELAKGTVEEHARSDMVRNLASVADLYVNDGFAVAHRAQASIVGFPQLLPSMAGRVMERELTALNRVKTAEAKPCVYVLGGAKADDAASVTEYVLSERTADTVLTGGVIGELFIHAQGTNLGDAVVKYLEGKDVFQYVPAIRELFARFNGQILTPIDFGIDVEGGCQIIGLDDLPTAYPMFDIGPATVQLYADVLKTAKTIVLSGPMGVYERPVFRAGTQGVFDAVVDSDAFSVAGGGNTIEALEKLGLRDRISYVSTGGGALMEFLTGKILPGVAALERSHG